MNIKHLEVKRAYYADPENVALQYKMANGNWYDYTTPGEPYWESNVDGWRIKPKTIRIGEIDVPEPVRVALEVGQKYWVVYFHGTNMLVGEDTWDNDGYDGCWMRRGLIHLTREAAELHAKAMILVSGGTTDGID